MFRIVFKELFQHGAHLWTGILAIALGIASIVAVGTITRSSEKTIADQLESFGANILVLPKNSTLQDYYDGLQQSDIPQHYLSVLIDSGSLERENLTGKFSFPVEVKGKRVTLTGIFPKSEMNSRVSEQVSSVPSSVMEWGEDLSDINVVSKPAGFIDDIGPDRIAAGADIGKHLRLKRGDVLDLLDRRFIVEALLPVTGTVDDSRLFARLSTVHQLSGGFGKLHSIEISGGASSSLPDLIGSITSLLPDTRVVTIRHVIGTQQKITATMRRISIALLAMLSLVGGACIANFLFANACERRHEIGIYSALGASGGWIVGMFLLKAVILGITGGALGYAIGTFLAIALGSTLAGVQVNPVPVYSGVSVAIAAVISLVAGIIPALRASIVDPSSVMKEE